MQPLRRVWRFLEKRKTELPWALLGMHPKTWSEWTCAPRVQCSSIHNSQDAAAPKGPSTERRVKKRWGTCTVEYYSAVRRNERMPFAAKWLGLETVIGEGDGTPLQYSCLENPMDGGAWWAAVYGVAQSQTRLKLLSSSSSSRNCHAEFRLSVSQTKREKYL